MQSQVSFFNTKVMAVIQVYSMPFNSYSNMWQTALQNASLMKAIVAISN